jgi:hypothetical protein
VREVRGVTGFGVGGTVVVGGGCVIGGVGGDDGPVGDELHAARRATAAKAMGIFPGNFKSARLFLTYNNRRPDHHWQIF